MSAKIVGNYCVVHGYHYPKPLRTVVHHIWPQEFGGPTKDYNLVQVCDTGHYNVHALLTALLKDRAMPGGTRQEKRLAQLGYERIQAALADQAMSAQHIEALNRHIRETP